MIFMFFVVSFEFFNWIWNLLFQSFCNFSINLFWTHHRSIFLPLSNLSLIIFHPNIFTQQFLLFQPFALIRLNPYQIFRVSSKAIFHQLSSLISSFFKVASFTHIKRIVVCYMLCVCRWIVWKCEKKIKLEDGQVLKTHQIIVRLNLFRI